MDLLDRLPEGAVSWLQSASPGKSATRQQKIDAHRDIAQWLSDNSSRLFSPLCTSACSVHGRPCPVHPAFREALRSTVDPEPGHVLPMCINIAGVVCLPYTTAGSREGESSAYQVSHLVWLQERRERAAQKVEDAFILECVPQYPIKTLKEEMHDSHEVVHVTIGPEYLGWPAKRRRLLACGFAKDRWAWRGPRSPSDIQKEFDAIFHRSVSAAGTLFLLADEEELHHEYAAMLSKQGHHFSPEQVKEIPKDMLLPMILPAGALQRYDEWTECGEEICSIGGTAFILVSDHPHAVRGSCGSELPVLLRKK